MITAESRTGNNTAESDVWGYLTHAIQLLPAFSPLLPLLTDALSALGRRDYSATADALRRAQREAQRQGLWHKPRSAESVPPAGATAPVTEFARAIEIASHTLHALWNRAGDALTWQDLELALSRVRGAVGLGDSVFVGHGHRGWYVGREGLSHSEPEILDKSGKWCGSDDHYFPALIDALRHAKRWGYLT